VRAFLENPLFVRWLTLIMNLADLGTFSEIFLINDSFIMLLAKKIEFNARVQKCHFGKSEKLPIWHF
jgi:hypothetical protein